MKINVCVNGLFRYRNYIQYYDKANELGKFYFSHRMKTAAGNLGVQKEKLINFWPKEYLLHVGLALNPLFNEDKLYIGICEAWQAAVMASWEDCDVVEAVTGGIADRVLRFAKKRGARIVGHPVNSHPLTYAYLVNREAERLGLKRGTIPDSITQRKIDELRTCDWLIVDSSFVKKSFVENGFPEDRISVILGAAPPRFFEPRTLDESKQHDKFRVVCVGTISARKGQRYLLEAWRKLSLPNAELILVGSLSRTAESVLNGFDGCYTHYSSIPNHELRKLLVNSDIFVLPSVEDGFAQAALEALSCGLPSIVTQNMGVADLITHGEDGIIVPPFDVDSIASAIEAFYRNPEFSAAIGRGGASTVQNLVSWESYAEKALAVLRGVARKN
ncbi:glycosyltransferase family 4 protein [Methylosinus sp. R-45379]|jgi:glycosyltransferase involved in cell wall biosynthesis|uniref:glycosyltransferase family 4 protein n=1 Tax=Methylosinus sp. R-45379 TaxID=980563 RepID=UPI000A00FADC|nr:glycosyltransferase family 4 protein [Methylosinus sp. R-45379]